MPQVNSDPTVEDQKFKHALKYMLPIPSNSEQQILLDEYNTQLTQFSVAVNRIITEEVCDENCVYLLQLLAGMYTLLKTTLLSPPVYHELFKGVGIIEKDARHYISQWATTIPDSQRLERQAELFELGWWCESALPRAYLVTLLYSSLPALWHDSKYINDTFSVCKALQHPLKGSFLITRLHSFLLKIYFIIENEEIRTLLLGFSVESFTTLLRLFVRWHQSLPSKSTDPSYVASLFNESFGNIFGEIARMCTFDMFEAVVLPTFLVEIVNCADPLAQSLLFESIIREFDPQYLLSQLDQIIKASSQFAQGINLKSLLNQLFCRVKTGGQLVFFDTIWDETSKLIKNRCEIDQSDTVIISSLVLSLISQEENSNMLAYIEKVLEFLIKTLKTIRSDGFNSETTTVGKEIVQLVSGMMDDFDFENVILKTALLPELLTCLKGQSARKCCLKVICPKLRNLNRPESFTEIIRLFGCLTKCDLVQLLDDGDQSEECLQYITEDLKEFTRHCIDLLPKTHYKQFYESIESPSSCLNLFILPDLLNYDDLALCKRIINTGYLRNTSTVLPQRLQLQKPVEWIEPEYTKLMAVKLNLKVIESIHKNERSRGKSSNESSVVYEFYTEILTILSNNVSQDYLKIQIIEQVISSLCSINNSDTLSPDDFKCLLDHLAKEASLLLRKVDRCKILLMIIPLNLDIDAKYTDQMVSLLCQLPDDTNEKFTLSCELLDILLVRKLRSNEQIVYDWALKESKTNSAKEIEFYSIKLKYDSHDHDHENNEISEGSENVQVNTCDLYKTTDSPDNSHTQLTSINHPFEMDNTEPLTELTSDDLQKLKIFQSFDME